MRVHIGASERFMCAASTALFVASLWGRPAAAQVTDEERREADCIDAFNDRAHSVQSDAIVPANPWLLKSRLEGTAAHAHPAETTAARGAGYGGRLDIDGMPIPLMSTGQMVTGPWIGASASASTVPDDSLQYSGEVRLGLARRRLGAAFSRVSGRCRMMRHDLTIDFVRWRLGGFTDLRVTSHPGTLVSSVVLVNVASREAFSSWGWQWSLTFLDFRLAPSFKWGPAGAIELNYRALLLTLRSGFLVPRFEYYVAGGVGVLFAL